MGSFAAVPFCLAAILCRKPLFLHDGNAVIGKANGLLARHARALALSLPLAPGQKVQCPTRQTGLPVREDLRRAAAVPTEREQALERFGLSPQLPVILVFGGSQGAEALNTALRETAAALASGAAKDARFQIIHLSGQPDNQSLEQAYAQAGIKAYVAAWDNHMADCYTAADLVISRAGASTISELALFGKAAILIPLPSSANAHQQKNAEVCSAADAAVHLPQEQAVAERLTELITNWLTEPAKWQKYGRQIRHFARPQAAKTLVDMLYDPEFRRYS
jgi:UDP-N-acetylglucosamine--N-acetylmuramyl-(pentapeptide) pyrophosphoryl-undecaprenol N-acetylglucosamine transferase